eukprot:173048-Hanusia_phi.AAC.1
MPPRPGPTLQAPATRMRLRRTRSAGPGRRSLRPPGRGLGDRGRSHSVMAAAALLSSGFRVRFSTRSGESH